MSASEQMLTSVHLCRYALQGFEPLQYQWYKDERKLYVATSSSPQLILVDVAAADSGTYHCQVNWTCNGHVPQLL